MIGNEMESGPEFSVECAGIIANVLTCVLAPAVKFAVVPDGTNIDPVLAAARLKTLRQKLLREAKSAFSEGVPYSLEAKGVSEALAIIEWVCDCVHNQI